MNSFIACFNLSSGMFVYRVEKSKAETEEALIALFSFLNAVSTDSLFWTGQKVIYIYIFMYL